MALKGTIVYHGVVSNDDHQKFMDALKEHIENCGENYAEVQYHPVMQLSGKVLLTAYVIGRTREDD